MKHPIGFCVQGSAPEAVPAPAAPAETAAVPSVVRVFFPERGQAYSYYNDRFDLHDGDLVYVSGKLARQRGQVVAVDYNFRIRLADYERVIGAADRNVRGTFYALGAHLVTLEPNVLPFQQVRGWFLPPEADGEYAVGHGPGRVVCYLPAAADVWPYTRVCTSVSIARSSEGVRAPPVVSRYSGIGLPPGASAG